METDGKVGVHLDGSTGGRVWQVYDGRKKLRTGQLDAPESVAALPMFAALVVEYATAEMPAETEVTTGVEIVVGDVVIHVVGILRPVVQPAASLLPIGRAEILQGPAVGAHLVGDEVLNHLNGLGCVMARGYRPPAPSQAKSF